MNIQFAPLLIKLFKFSFVFIASVLLVWFWAAVMPFDGPELGVGKEINCGDPSGFPLAFVGTWKYLDGVLHPSCAKDFNYLAFGLNLFFWTSVFYLLGHLIKNNKTKKEKNVL